MDEAMSIPGMLAEIMKSEAQDVDAYVIACFDDPGLHAAREVAKVQSSVFVKQQSR